MCMGKKERKMKYRRGCEGVKIKKEGSRRKELGICVKEVGQLIPLLYMSKNSCELDVVFNGYNLSMWEAGAEEL